MDTIIVAIVGAFGIAISSFFSYKAGASRVQFDVEALKNRPYPCEYVKELQEKYRRLGTENHATDITLAEIKKDLGQIKELSKNNIN